MVYCFSLAASTLIGLPSPFLRISSKANLTAKYLERWSTVAFPEVLMYLVTNSTFKFRLNKMNNNNKLWLSETN